MPRLAQRLSLSAVLLLFVVGLPAVAGERLAAEIGQVIGAAEFKHAHWGILVVDLAGGQTVYELNADRMVAPASVTKLYSTAAALDTLGADYRFETPVYRLGEVDAAGKLQGDLILVASGDLSLGGRTLADGRIAFKNSDHTYANGSTTGELTEPDPLAGLNELARQVAQAGIKRIGGDVFIDDRLFDREAGTGSGPRRLTPIMVNDNLIDLTIAPGEPGKPARVTWRPQSALVQVDARIETAPAGEALATTIRAGVGRSVLLTGKIPAGHKPVVRVFEVADASAFARGLFVEALERAGVTVEASPLADPLPGVLLARDEVAKLPRVAHLTSPPFGESARLILKVSHNLHASTLPLLLASRHGKRNLGDGLHLQRDVLRRLGVDVDTISFGGGAGGSSADLVTPRATVQLLRHMASRSDAAVYRDALPILGVDGTLSESVGPQSPARGKVQAKTGTYYVDNTLRGKIVLTSKALAGYMTTAANRELAIALFVNNVHLEKTSETARVGKTLGRLCEIIYGAE
ncbi:MAG: D-alanyl-D-alanine carboxypeptidase/D-alanyl-D-alanine-endopeptidase [Planctomycetia bacterium]|nr:D-alanyl-D-alanine carboxypeptidase/D-alanyl-D-alanine-endopeptidase [Planctomycetia bacterium]